ncbi:MAG TPA: hypothetical protein VN665_01160 [Candidatus Paceibacterota bacterium]|nr:hypothetical protein [Candidatus Paceibacterota bacterium]
MDTKTIKAELLKHFPNLKEENIRLQDKIGDKEIQMILTAFNELDLNIGIIREVVNVKPPGHVPKMRDKKGSYCQEICIPAEPCSLDIYYNHNGWWGELIWHGDGSTSETSYHSG